VTLNGVKAVILRYYAERAAIKSELHVKLAVSGTTLSATKMQSEKSIF